MRRKVFDDSPAPSGNSMLAYVLLRLSRIYGDDELEEKAVSVFKLILGGLQNAGRRSAGGSSQSTSTSRSGARSRSSGRRRARWRRRRCAAGIPAR